MDEKKEVSQGKEATKAILTLLGYGVIVFFGIYGSLYEFLRIKKIPLNYEQMFLLIKASIFATFIVAFVTLAIIGQFIPDEENGEDKKE